MLDLLTLCNIIEMGNILTPKLYTDKDKCNRERHELIEARRISRSVVDWLFDHYQLSLNGSLVPKSRQTLYWPYLAHQAKTLLWYIQKIEQENPPKDRYETACTYEAVKHAIRSCFRTVVPFWNAWDACQETQSFAWPGPPFDVVTREPTAGHRKSKTTSNYSKTYSLSIQVTMMGKRWMIKFGLVIATTTAIWMIALVEIWIVGMNVSYKTLASYRHINLTFASRFEKEG